MAGRATGDKKVLCNVYTHKLITCMYDICKSLLFVFTVETLVSYRDILTGNVSTNLLSNYILPSAISEATLGCWVFN